MSQEFSEALNDCLERLIHGEDLRECLGRYPRQALDLEPLLQVALATIRAAEAVRPDPDARARNFSRFSQALAAGPQQAERGSSWRSWRWIPVARPFAIGFASLLLFVLGAGVATAASTNSVPGEPLYWVKTTRESVEQRIPRSDDNRAIYEAGLAQARTTELGKLIERGYFTQADRTMRRMNDHLVRSARYAGVTVSANPIEMPFKPPMLIGDVKAEQLRHRLEQDRKVFRAKVRLILPTLNADDRSRAERVFRRTELGYWLLIDAMYTATPQGRTYLIVPAPRSGPAR